MSTGVTVHSEDGEISVAAYCQNVAGESFAGLFDLLAEQEKSDFGRFLVDGEEHWGNEISKLPDPANPTPEEIAAIEAMTGAHDPATVLTEAERAYAAIQEMEDSQFDHGKAGLLADFDDELLPALREAKEKGFQIELMIG